MTEQTALADRLKSRRRQMMRLAEAMMIDPVLASDPSSLVEAVELMAALTGDLEAALRAEASQ